MGARRRATETMVIDVPFDGEGSEEWGPVLRLELHDGSLSLEVGETRGPDGYRSAPARARLVLPAEAGPNLLEPLYAVLEDNAPSAIAALDEDHTWVVDRSDDSISLEIHPGDVLSWRASRWHAELDLPLTILPGLVRALRQLLKRG